jgi:hypothetical protein
MLSPMSISFCSLIAASVKSSSVQPDIRELNRIRRHKYEASRTPSSDLIDIPYLSLQDTADYSVPSNYTMYQADDTMILSFIEALNADS